MKKKLRKPQDFGWAYHRTYIKFAVNKSELVLDCFSNGSESSNDCVYFESPGQIRSLADKLLRAAAYLEQEGA